MPQSRRSLSPFLEGFAALSRDPALIAGELVWRWCFGFSAWALALMSFGVFLDGLTISRGDEFLLSTLQPLLLSTAVHDIFRGSLLRFVWMTSLLLIGLALPWSFAATAGRAATLRRLIELFRTGDEASLTWQFRPIFVLQLLRASWSLAGLAAALASMALGIAMVLQQHPARAAFFLTFGVVSAFFFGMVLNWFLGLAPLFCLRENVGAREAIALTTDFCVARGGEILGLSVGFFAVWILWVVTMGACVVAVLSLVRDLSAGWLTLLLALVALVYFAGADLLYLARLGGYAALAEAEEDLSPSPTFPDSTLPSQTIDPTQLPPAIESA